MADILDAAQTNTPPVPEPVEPPPVPPVSSEPPAPSSDSLIVPPSEEPAPNPPAGEPPPPPPPPPPPEEPKLEEVKPPEKPKKKSRLGVLLAGLLLLVIALPMLVVFVRQQIEIRSRAAGVCTAKLGSGASGANTCPGASKTACCINISVCDWSEGCGTTPTPSCTSGSCSYGISLCSNTGLCNGSGSCAGGICCKSCPTTTTPRPSTPAGQSCTTGRGWPGTCTTAGTCPYLDRADTDWDSRVTPCNQSTGTVYGCCGIKPTTPTSCSSLRGSCISANYCYLPNKKVTPDCTGTDICCYGTPPTPTIKCCCAGGVGGGSCTLVNASSCPANLPTEAASILACSPSTGTIKCCCAGGVGAVASCAWVSGSCPANMPVTAATSAACSGSNIITPTTTPGGITYDPACSTLGSGWISAGSNRDAAEEACIGACDNTTQSASHPNCINGTIQRPTPMGTVPNYCYKCAGAGCTPGACNQNMAASCNIVAGQCIRNGWNGCNSCFIDCNLPNGCGGVTPTTPPPQCINIVAYKDGNALSASELSALQPGDTITLAFAPGGKATKVHFRVNAGAWHETTAKNTKGQFTWNYTLEDATSFTIKAQWFRGGKWH